MNMTQIFGHFPEEKLVDDELFMIDFFLQSIPEKVQKKTRCLSVDFIADYLANLLPTPKNDSLAVRNQLEFKGMTSYIVNELLENSMKFKDENSSYPVKFKIYWFDEMLVFISINSVNLEVLHKFKEFINVVINSNPDELYFHQLEKGAEERINESRLGFLSMIIDYGAKLGWKIETIEQDPETIAVTTMVQLSV